MSNKSGYEKQIERDWYLYQIKFDDFMKRQEEYHAISLEGMSYDKMKKHFDKQYTFDKEFAALQKEADRIRAIKIQFKGQYKMINGVIDMLGFEAEDKITGCSGTISSVSFDLYGCIQVLLTPKVKKGTETKVYGWFDVARIKIKSKKRIMEHPSFEQKYKTKENVNGPAEKPMK